MSNQVLNLDKNKSRKVLSFDVGIINLAYCILDIDDEKRTFKIDNWGIINLADGRKLCCFIKNNGEQCGNIARHVLNLNEHNRYYYCKSHVVKANACTRMIDLEWSEVLPEDVETCSYHDCKKSGEAYLNVLPGQYCKTHQKKVLVDNKFVCANKKCSSKISFGLYLPVPNTNDDGTLDMSDLSYDLSTGWCSSHFDDDYKEFLTKKTKKYNQSSNEIPLGVLGVSMYEKLDKMVKTMNILKVDEVLIENQPAYINPTMKTISSMLLSYFIMRGIYEQDITKSTIKSVNFCSPSNKIKVGGKTVNDRLENAEEGKVYNLTKELGKRFCKALISDDDKWLKFIESHTKIDDLCDAFLQAFVANFGSNLPEIYVSKIRTVDTNVYQRKVAKVKSEIVCDDLTVKIGSMKSLNKKDQVIPVKTVKKTFKARARQFK